MQGLTERQQQVLNAIASYIKEKGYSPTIRELAQELGFKSTSTLHAHLQRLEKKVTSQKKKGNQEQLQSMRKTKKQGRLEQQVCYYLYLFQPSLRI